VAVKIDVSGPLLRPSQLEALVRAVADAGEHDEHDWLEWKSRLDLTQTRAREHIAKHVLGFSNRTVQTAALHAGGHGHVLIGVEPGSVTGVETIDPADLTSAILRYVGTDGPQWNAEHVTVAGQTVLVVVVDPPRHGDRPHTLRHRLQNHEPGQVLVRRIGQTVQASPAEHAALVDRAMASRNSLTVAARATCLTIEGGIADAPDRLEAAIEAERELLLRPRRARRPAAPAEPISGSSWLRGPVQPPPGLRVSRSSFGQPTYEPDKRTEAEYVQEVEQYLDRLRGVLLRRLVCRRWRHPGSALRLTIDNLTARNFAQLRVRVHVAGAVRRWSDEITDDLEPVEDLPKRPRRMGERKRVESTYDHIVRGVGTSIVPSSTFDNQDLWSPGFTINDGGSVDIEYDPIHLHPSTPEPLLPVPLLVDEPVGTELAVTWSATAESADGLARGELSVLVVESTLTFDTLPAE